MFDWSTGSESWLSSIWETDNEKSRSFRWSHGNLPNKARLIKIAILIHLKKFISEFRSVWIRSIRLSNSWTFDLMPANISIVGSTLVEGFSFQPVSYSYIFKSKRTKMEMKATLVFFGKQSVASKFCRQCLLSAQNRIQVIFFVKALTTVFSIILIIKKNLYVNLN